MSSEAFIRINYGASLHMLKKGTKAYSILKWKCPRCHEGDLFVQSGEKNYSFIGYTPQRCKVCGQSFILEPGFYYGAMYLSYSIAVFIALPQFAVWYILFDVSFRNSILLLLVVQVFITPWLYRTSRSLWINFFVSFDNEFSENAS